MAGIVLLVVVVVVDRIFPPRRVTQGFQNKILLNARKVGSSPGGISSICHFRHFKLPSDLGYLVLPNFCGGRVP